MAISSLIGRYAVKAAGAVGVGILTYDAHKRGVLHGKINKNKHDFQALDYYYENSRNPIVAEVHTDHRGSGNLLPYRRETFARYGFGTTQCRLLFPKRKSGSD